MSSSSCSSASASLQSQPPSSPYFPVGYPKEPWYNLEALRGEDLASFFQSQDNTPKKAPTYFRAITTYFFPQKPLTEVTDFIHFIWMGNPIKESDIHTILTWKRKYRSKQIVLWTDNKALAFDRIKEFAQANDIRLLDIEEIISDKYSFGLSEQLQREKDRLPPNWGAVSDMYRYLIMYWFAGIYSDTDSPIQEGDTELDCTKSMAFSSLDHMFGNDQIMTRDLRNVFWQQLLEEIRNNYFDPEVSLDRYIKSHRLSTTLQSSGPARLRHHVDEYRRAQGAEEIQFLVRPADPGNYSWNGKLTQEKCARLSHEPTIVAKYIP